MWRYSPSSDQKVRFSTLILQLHVTFWSALRDSFNSLSCCCFNFLLFSDICLCEKQDIHCFTLFLCQVLVTLTTSCLQEHKHLLLPHYDPASHSCINVLSHLHVRSSKIWCKWYLPVAMYVGKFIQCTFKSTKDGYII